MLCHVVVERLPSEALPEVLENVREAWSWYTRPPVPMQLTTVVAGPGIRLGTTVTEAPPFRITEE
jgi:hypothetical protein